MYLAIIILPLLGLIVSGLLLRLGYKSKILKVLLSLTFYILLLWPFKVILPLLGLNYLFPIFSGLFACIFVVANRFLEGNKELFTFIQLLYMFTLACALAYFSYAFTPSEYLSLLFSCLPLFAEGYIDEGFVYLPSKFTLFMEGNNSPSPPSNSPMPMSSGSSSSSNSASPLPSTTRLTFEQELWINRFRSLEDARRLDIAKRILLHKIISSKQNVPYEIEQSIQDHIWGNHWYYLYRNPLGDFII
jgi:hypothetical protein